MMTMQNNRDALRTEIRNQVRDAIRGTGSSTDQPQPPVAPAAPDARPALPAIPPGGGRLTVDKQGNRTVFTTAAMPPEVMVIARRAEETAFGLMGLLAAIIILGPFARVVARRMERKDEIKAAGENSAILQQQLHQLQESMDAMTLEVERIGESQRFQSKLLVERKGT